VIKVRFLPAAEIEFLREVAYYAKARAGAGLRFQAAVQAAMFRAATHPLGGTPSFKETRSALVKDFPFSVVYRPSAHEVLVVAIAPSSKAPLLLGVSHRVTALTPQSRGRLAASRNSPITSDVRKREA